MALVENRRIRRLRFRLTDDELHAAIVLLGAFCPRVMHPRAWQTLTTELERRQAAQPPQDIEMMSGVFETLPSVVQARLRSRGAEQRRAA